MVVNLNDFTIISKGAAMIGEECSMGKEILW
jgi:hypothetical protein